MVGQANYTSNRWVRKIVVTVDRGPPAEWRNNLSPWKLGWFTKWHFCIEHGSGVWSLLAELNDGTLRDLLQGPRDARMHPHNILPSLEDPLLALEQLHTRNSERRSHGDIQLSNLHCRKLPHSPDELSLAMGDFESFQPLNKHGRHKTGQAAGRFNSYGVHAAPELMDRPPDARSDVYAFGGVLLLVLFKIALSDADFIQFQQDFSATWEGHHFYTRKGRRPCINPVVRRYALTAFDTVIRDGEEGKRLLLCLELVFNMLHWNPGKRPSMGQVRERYSMLLAADGPALYSLYYSGLGALALAALYCHYPRTTALLFPLRRTRDPQYLEFTSMVTPSLIRPWLPKN